MLRIIHTGRAYEVIDGGGYPELHNELGKVCREVWKLKELLENAEQKLRITELELELCLNTRATHGLQDPR